MLCWSDDISLLDQYLLQLDSIAYKSNTIFDINITPTTNTNLPVKYELTCIGQNIIVSNLEYIYYEPIFTELYTNMQTAISSIILYNKLCGNNGNLVQDVASTLYKECKTFIDFMDNIDTDVVLRTYFHHPIDIMNTLKENYRMKKELNEITGKYKPY
jgi:hypothetical protein